MTDALRNLMLACAFVGAVLLVTLAVSSFSPIFVAVPLAVLCAIASHVVLRPAPQGSRLPACSMTGEMTLVPRPGDCSR